MRARSLLSYVLAATALLAPVAMSPAGATAPDPAATGSHTVTEIEYDAGTVTIVSDDELAPGLPPVPRLGRTPVWRYPQELKGVLYVPSGTGPFPVVVLLHGVYDRCPVEYVTQPPTICPRVPWRSYGGYAYLGRNLASHGYLVMSIDAMEVNELGHGWPGLHLVNLGSPFGPADYGMSDRAQLIDASLKKLVEWNAGPATAPASLSVGTTLVGRVDMTRIGLMGHSRGGEGLERFLELNRTPTGPRYPGVVAALVLAPSGWYTEVPYGVHFGALLPLCDGDASNQPGAAHYDNGRFADPAETHARVQYTVVGANHNWFNTEWLLDDYTNFFGTRDSACSLNSPTSARLSASDQRDVGLDLMAAFFRRYVGGETAFDAVVKGAEPLAASACPGAATTCPNLVGTSYLAPAADRLMVVTPTSTTTTETGRPLTTTGFTTYSSCTPPGCPTSDTKAGATQLTLAWNGAATLTANVSTAGTDVSGFGALTFRSGVNYDDSLNTTSAQDFDVTVHDASGGSATVHAADYTNALNVPPGDVDRELTLNGAWVPLSAFAGVDLTHVTSVELGFGTRTTSGSIQLAELAFQS